MADAEEIASKVLDVIGGLGGAVVGAMGGGSEGAKAAQAGTGAIKDIIGAATGSSERKRAEAAKSSAASEEQRKLEERRLALEERRIKMQEDEARARRDKIREFDAPMYTSARSRPAAVAAQGWQPSTLRDGDRIVDLVDAPGKAPEEAQPLVSDARDSVLLRRGNTADVVLVDRGPLVDGASPETYSRPPDGPERPPLVASRPLRNFERAGDVPDDSHNPNRKEA